MQTQIKDLENSIIELNIQNQSLNQKLNLITQSKIEPLYMANNIVYYTKLDKKRLVFSYNDIEHNQDYYNELNLNTTNIQVLKNSNFKIFYSTISRMLDLKYLEFNFIPKNDIDTFSIDMIAHLPIENLIIKSFDLANINHIDMMPNLKLLYLENLPNLINIFDSIKKTPHVQYIIRNCAELSNDNSLKYLPNVKFI